MHNLPIKTIAMLGAATILLAGCNNKTVRGGGVGGNGNPAKPGPAKQINLIWNKTKNEWKVKFPGDPNEYDPKTAETHLDKDVGPTQFEVDIQGSSPLPTFKDDALTVWVGDKSDPGNGKTTTQILGPVVNKKGTLIFWDLNQGDPLKINYSLHFNGAPDADPIIDNGGGTNIDT